MYVTEEQKQKIYRMLDLMEKEPLKYNQNKFPLASSSTLNRICGAEMCCAGFMILANAPDQFTKLIQIEKTVFSKIAQGIYAFKERIAWDEKALDVFGISDPKDRDIIDLKLFSTHLSWPEPFRSHYAESHYAEMDTDIFDSLSDEDILYHHKERVKIARARWEHFIETGE